jgi:hypothetical protein
VLDLSRLAEGEYLVELTVGGDARPSAMARRRLTVRR